MGMLSHPGVLALALPLGLTLALAGLLRLALGPERSGAALGLGVIAAHLLRSGLPHLPPAGVGDKLVYLLAAATLGGTLLESRPRLAPWLVGAIMLAAVAWLAYGRWTQARGAGDYLLLLAVVGAAPVLLGALSREADGARLLVVLLLAGASLALFAPAAQDAAAVAAGAAALLWWSLAGATPPRVAVLLAGGGALVAIAANLALYGAPPLLALLVWLPVFVLPAWAAPIPALLAPMVAWHLAG